MISEIHIGTLYTHILHGQVFIVGSANDYNVTVLNTIQAKEYHIPVGIFKQWFIPFRRTHE